MLNISTRCILSKFYIKPQRIRPDYLSYRVVSYRNSTSNHNRYSDWLETFFVVSYRNSTSNHNSGLITGALGQVVSYRNSTSNHNEANNALFRVLVVSYRNSTSNHNSAWSVSSPIVLYLIEILHQTTTIIFNLAHPMGCILSKFYIKPQQQLSPPISRRGCILSKFYIKPQQWYLHI